MEERPQRLLYLEIYFFSKEMGVLFLALLFLCLILPRIFVRARAHIRTHTNEINAIYIYFIIIYIRNNVQLYSKEKKETTDKRKGKENKKVRK